MYFVFDWFGFMVDLIDMVIGLEIYIYFCGKWKICMGM